MSSDTNKSSILSNFIWRYFERCGAQGVTFIVSIVLARLLDPTVYGTVALVTVYDHHAGVRGQRHGERPDSKKER